MDEARAAHQRAEAARRTGKLGEAAAQYRRVAELRPSGEALVNLGNALLELHQTGDALRAYQQALALDPRQPAACFGIGCALRDSHPADAAAAFSRAIVLAPEFAPAHEKLVDMQIAAGNGDAACAAICQALLRVDTPALRAAFTELFSVITPAADAPGLRQIMLRALSERWTRPQDLAVAAGALAALHPPIRADDLLLRTLLTITPVCDADVEQALTAQRRALLERVMSSAATDTSTMTMLSTLARQGWINEFAWSVTPAESLAVADLGATVQAALDGGQTPPMAQVVALAMYRPLSTLRQAERLLAARPPAAVAAVFTQQIAEPAEEARLRADIPRATAIEDTTSQNVRGQYEENPYPRWVVAPAVPPRRPLGAWLAARYPSVNLPSGRPLRLLVAGCGTGQHPLELARCFSGAEILAIDLSLASLGYAARMTKVLGVTGIDYRQADLLRAGELGGRFDVIESSGVLHHLDDLWAGWRSLLSVLEPGGVMTVSLYTEKGRADVRAARGWIARQGYPATAEGLRQCRQDMRDLSDRWARNLTSSPDFASLSGCRDLLFHVRESAVTPLQVKSFLEKEGLTLLGVETSAATRRAFLASEGENRLIDLAAWDRFERKNPDCFKGMIHLWVSKPNR